MKTLSAKLSLSIAILVLLFPLALAAQDSAPTALGLRPDAPTYALHGPYWVGTQEFVMNADTGNAIPLTAWYPALNPEGLVESVEYIVPHDGFIGEITPADMPLLVYGKALLNAAPDLAQGPYPLVVFSPGYGWQRHGYANLLEHLASWGFIVLAPSHFGEFSSRPIEDNWASYMNRPLVIQNTIAFASNNLTAENGSLAGLIDTETIAVMGHSSGGWTALLAAGGRLDTQNWTAWCAAAPERADLLDCQALNYQNELAGMVGLDAVPEGLWPALNDPRVDAMIDLSNGMSWALGETGLSAITVPTMAIMGTTEDPFGTEITPPDSGPLAVYEYVASEQKSLVLFANASHILAGNDCNYAPFWTALELDWVCRDPVWDMDRGHDLLNHFTTAFLLDTLKGDMDAHTALAPANVIFPGISYEAQGY